jgi:hypothetical protein
MELDRDFSEFIASCAAIQARMSASNAWTLLWTPRCSSLVVSSPNQRSILLSS